MLLWCTATYHDSTEKNSILTTTSNPFVADKRAVASRLGVTLPISHEELEVRKNVTNVQLVISHCEEHVDWIKTFVGDAYNVKRITIYSKCGNFIRGLDELARYAPTQVVRYDNVGRCDHSYAHWIKEHYKEIEANVDTDGEDVVTTT